MFESYIKCLSDEIASFLALIDEENLGEIEKRIKEGWNLFQYLT